MNKSIPIVFFGHGNPMNALANNYYTKGWAAIGKTIPKPKAILAVSAHWYVPQCAIAVNANPPTIHDFGGFPKALYGIEYPAPGCVELAVRVQALLAPTNVLLDENWGLDHGVWSVLLHVYPEADVPVVQLSIDNTQPPAFHYALGERLKPLRDEGVLIVGSGNIVHNLPAYAWGNPDAGPFDWAVRFEAFVKRCLAEGDDESLLYYLQFGQDAVLSAPTPEHYLPLIYLLGLRGKSEPVSFPVGGFEGGSLSMLTIQFG